MRTIRFWSDAGVLPPAAAWTVGGRRLYDAAGVARLDLVVTLRELRLGLPDVRRVMDGQPSGKSPPPTGTRSTRRSAPCAAPRGAGCGGEARGR